MTEATKAALDKIMELTFEDAVNGHIHGVQILTREQIGEIYEAARVARWPSFAA